MQSLEIPPTAATLAPQQIGAIGSAIAKQAKSAAQAEAEGKAQASQANAQVAMLKLEQEQISTQLATEKIAMAWKEVNAKIARDLATDDHSPGAEYVREVAQSVLDHRAAELPTDENDEE